MKIYLKSGKPRKMQAIRDSERWQKERLGFAIADALRAKGWRYTCDVPGSLWLWEKKLADGRVALVNESAAVSIQCWIDEFGEKVGN